MGKRKLWIRLAGLFLAAAASFPAAGGSFLAAAGPGRADEPPAPPPAGKDTVGPLQPPAEVRGRARQRGLFEILEAARAAARSGAGYEAARLLTGLLRSAPESEPAAAARRQLADWEVLDLPLSDATAAEAARRVAGSFRRDEEARLGLARAENLMEFGQFRDAARTFLEVAGRRLLGEALESLSSFLGRYGLPASEGQAIPKRGEDELERLLERLHRMSRFADQERLLGEVDPEAGRIYTSLLRKAYPESGARKDPEEREGFGFNFRPPGGMRGGFVFERPGRDRPEEPAAARKQPSVDAAPASAAEALSAAGRLLPHDPSLARALLELALAVHAGSPEAAQMRELLLKAEKLSSTPGAGGRREESALKPPSSEGAAAQGGVSSPRTAGEDPFESPRVRSYQIELSPESQAQLRSAPKTFVKGTFRVGEEVLSEVGVRLKGSIGSFQSLEGQNKPGFTIKFDSFKEAQRFHGLRKMILNNAVQDPSFLSEPLGYQLFREAGLPAPRTAFVSLSVNGQPYGLYVQVEAVTHSFLSRWFEDGSGDLYEGPGDITEWQRLDLDSNQETAPREVLGALAEAAQLAMNEQSLEPLQEFMDLNRLARFMAMENLLDHWDGYGPTNNYRIYYDPGSGLFSLLPHGADQLFGNVFADVFRTSRGILYHALLESPGGREIYRRELEQILAEVWEPSRLAERVRDLYQRIRAYAIDDARGATPGSGFEERIHHLLTFFEKRRRFVHWQLLGEEEPEIAERLAQLARPSFPFLGPGGDRFGGGRGPRPFGFGGPNVMGLGPGGPGGFPFGPGGPPFGPGGPQFGPGGPAIRRFGGDVFRPDPNGPGGKPPPRKEER